MEKSATGIETPKIVYGALLFSWTFVAYMSAVLIAMEGAGPGSVMIAVPLDGILFSATGIVRPKRIQLNRLTLAYRPVWGRTLVVRKADVEGFDIFVVRFQSGFLICKMRSEAVNGSVFRYHNLGFLLGPDEMVRTLRRWLGCKP